MVTILYSNVKGARWEDATKYSYFSISKQKGRNLQPKDLTSPMKDRVLEAEIAELWALPFQIQNPFCNPFESLSINSHL
ncbi:hypothetical protein CDAR_419281 [Caerostris darwini]|uniref:Uncharacterized protein n=1 Tax=Caerostris darwini TaxID=1538125 RepID=A0AAV4TQH6_9ARAC|nr:hypothetical protein CDAR_419281 [Caerostris darwini]